MPALKKDEELKGIDTILGQDTTFEGKLSFNGEVRIAGKFKGEINAKGVLYVEDTAQIAAEVGIGTLIVFGEIIGNIKASESISLKVTARIKGNIETPSLTIDKGALFEGSCKMDKQETIKPIQLVDLSPQVKPTH